MKIYQKSSVHVPGILQIDISSNSVSIALTKTKRSRISTSFMPQIMNLDMDEVEIRHFQVLVRAIDTELKDLSIWTIPRPQNLDFRIIF